MKYFIYILLVIWVASCETKSKSNNSATDKSKIDSLAADSILTFSFLTNFRHQNILNKSDRQIDLLFNGIDEYLGGQPIQEVHFRTECLRCEAIQKYRDGLLFGRRLLITTDKIMFFRTDRKIQDDTSHIKLNSENFERTNPEFKFSAGKGKIKYIGVSCNDADYNKVRLSYPTGEIVIDSLINASFFEYDLNTDGQNEQYLMGSRNCSQELIVLRIRKPNDLK